MLEKTKQIELIEEAIKARQNAYAPYSCFYVGAALLCADGMVFTGVNLENGSFGGTICAERVALSKALSEGKRDFSAIAVVGGHKNVERPEKLCPPCGICRQFMAEFCRGDFEVILYDGQAPAVKPLSELLPLAFVFSEEER